MNMRPLGNTDINVSAICLGTMTFGEQNSESDAHEQLDYALEQGINFIDTAEAYPVPMNASTQGKTEAYIGTWLKARQNRDKVILASKVAGESERVKWLRDGNHKLDRKNIEQALEDSLKRLQTDYLDLYQLHWPDRDTNCFGQLGYTHNPEDATVSIEDILDVLADLVKSGKVRHVALSNETPWGVMRFLRDAELNNKPRVVSIQNPYSLLNRSFEVGLAEMAIKEQVGLLAYSPLGFGLLTGKYENGQRPPESRMVRYPNYFQRYTADNTLAAASEYIAIAKKHGLSPTTMALAFVNQQPFVTSNIIGATTMAQLKENIASIEVTLSADVLKEIERVHQRYTYPAP